jgi:predicted O-linked N-acetylglucosamine transferase (SPINDLY family)
MLYIIVDKINEKIISNIEFIFIDYKIKIFPLIKIEDALQQNSIDNFIFFTNFKNPIKDFYKKINDIISNKEIDFCYLTKENDIFFVRKSNLKFIDKTIDIKKEDKTIEIFFKDGNKIDHILVPDDINYEYITLLKAYKSSYDESINFKYAYKSYEKFLKYVVKDNNCYNIILFINSIEELKKLTLPKYNFYRISLFHNFRIKEDLDILNSFCKKNKILLNMYLPYFNWFFIVNNKRLIWFEKIILLNNNNLLNNELITKLNLYHQIKNNLLFEDVISISASDFVCIPLFNFTKEYKLTSYEIFNLVKKYINTNSDNVYSNLKINESIKINKFNNYKENQLMSIRDYNIVIDNINKNIKENYNRNDLFNLLLKKISIGILCKPETEIINELNILIQSISNLEYLSSLVILLSNVKNPKIMNKLYVKVLKLTEENKLSYITLKCFQNLLSINMDEEELDAALDFINYIKKDEKNTLNIDKNALKKIIISLFFTISKYLEKLNIIEKFNNIVNDIFDMSDVMNVDKVLAIKSNEFNKVSLLHFLIFMTTNFSAYYNSYEEFFIKRKEIKDNLIYLLSKDIPTCSLNDIVAIPVCNFYLSYQGVPSVDIFRLKSQLIRKICPDLNFKIDTNFKNKKINICFHGNHLNRWHSVFKDRHQVIKGLSEMEEFNVYFTTFDPLLEEVKYLFGKAKHIKLGSSLEEIKKTLVDLKLDVLVYCEIGMDPKAYFMAHMKLAKIQINTWGHSDTSGIDTVDYFFSSKLYELPYEESQTHYSEKLVLLDSLCTSYVNPILRYNIKTFRDRYEFGFTDEYVLFFCAQSLFKFNPIFDDYITQILNANKNFLLIILNSDSKSKIIKRYNNKNITGQIHVFPGMQHHQYLNLINICDVILDPFPFGGCNSSFEAFSLNKVIVTHASDMINGRFTTGFYKKMGLENLITYSKEDYINFAIKLGNDIEYRKSLEKIIEEKHPVLFNDALTITEWSSKIKEFLL